MSEQVTRIARQEQRWVGRRFGRWTVLAVVRELRYVKGYQYHVLTRCDCGTEKVTPFSALRGKRSSSCGCDRRAAISAASRKHGLSKSSIYRIYLHMKKRCCDSTSHSYRLYGGRGIAVCERWLGPDGVTNFAADMGPRPSLRHSVDRIDVNGPYSPDNCRWATPKEQNRNRRVTRLIEFNGQSRLLGEWAELTGLDESTLRHRLFVHGWPVEEALTMPALGGLTRKQWRERRPCDGPTEKMASVHPDT